MKTLLSRILSDQSKHSEACLDPNTGAAYVEGGLTRDEKRHVEEHLAECSRCRQAMLFAAIPERPPVLTRAESEEKEKSPAQAPGQRVSRMVAVKLALRNAIGAVETFFEGTLNLAGAKLRGEPVFRGGAPEVEGVNSVALGPYRLSLKRIEEGPRAGLYVRVTKLAGMPITGATAEIELESGNRFSGRTDKMGWVHIAGVAMDHIAAIWIDAAA